MKTNDRRIVDSYNNNEKIMTVNRNSNVIDIPFRRRDELLDSIFEEKVAYNSMLTFLKTRISPKRTKFSGRKINLGSLDGILNEVSRNNGEKIVDKIKIVVAPNSSAG